MKRTLFILLLLVVMSATAVAQTPVTFGPTDLGPGSSWIETATYHTKMPALTVGEVSTPPLERAISREKRVTVNDFDANGRIRQVTVLYANAGGGPAGLPGKSFVVTRAGNDAVVEGVGFEPTEAERAFVAADNANFNLFFACEKIFHRSKPFTTGVAESIHAFAEDLVNSNNGVNVDSMTIELTGVDAMTNVATFAVTSQLSTSMKKGRGRDGVPATGGMTCAMNGTMQVAVANSRILRLEIGPNLDTDPQAPPNVTITPRKQNDEPFSSATGHAWLQVVYTP